MSKNFIDRFYEEDAKEQFWSLNKKIGLGLAVLLLTVIMINTTGCTSNNTEDITNIEQPASIEDPVQKDSVKVGNDGVNAAIAPDSTDDVSIVSDQSLKNTTTMVSMTIEDTGRSDPFLPENEAAAARAKAQRSRVRPNPNLLPPPEAIVVDSTATDVMTTKVSGIMYDRMNPSAILNISGADYLVRSGDIINGYKVLSITKNTVTVQYGANVYKAGVGELFTGEGINFNTISNLESKFGGRKNSSIRR